MAGNRLKQTSKSSQEVDLIPDKEEEIPVKEIVKDARMKKVLGLLFLSLTIFLTISFISYFFTWQQDQDKVLQGSSHFLFAENIKVNNLLGRLGAFISHFFFYQGFGVSSFLFNAFLFTAGINLTFQKKIFSIGRTAKYVLVGLIFFSAAFAFVFQGNAFPWGGAVGEKSVLWLIGFIGQAGAGLTLLIIGFAYFIWRFNPSFSLPEKKQKLPEPEFEVKLNKENADDDVLESSTLNRLKNEENKLTINPTTEKFEQEFNITEREESENTEAKLFIDTNNIPLKKDEEVNTIIAPTAASTKKSFKEPLELEIKPTAEEIIEATVPKKVENLPPYDPVLDLRDYKYPTLDLLASHSSEKIVMDAEELDTHKNQIINTLKNYDIDIQKISATVGPTVTLYEIVPAAGVRISRIKNLEDDIALSLAALGIRIIAPIPGKGTIGIEVPNIKKTMVSMRSLLSSDKFQTSKFSLPIALGKKIDNENFIVDLTSMPHLLMAGATGQGKSVGVNAILISLLYKKHPSQLKFVLVDPKKVELSLYRVIENHFLAKLPGEEESIITDTKKVIHSLNALCIEMDNRYDLLKEAGCRNIREYNEKFISRKLNPEKGHQFLPFIVLVIDEFADLIMTAGKEIEMPIARLAQLARAVGIHLVIATQRPSVNIITGTIKANFPARIAFKVSSKIDSRTILDLGGAEQLIGKGDMLISYNGEIVRLQCAFVDTPEVDNVTDFIAAQRGYPHAFLLPEYIDERDFEGKDFDAIEKDSLFDDAAKLIVQTQIGSTSLLQRRMKLGYNRAGRLMDQLEAAGIVGPSQGSKARDVLVKTESDLNEILRKN